MLIAEVSAVEQTLSDLDGILEQIHNTPGDLSMQSSSVEATVTAVRERFEASHGEMVARLAGLEEAAGTWESVERDVEQLAHWLHLARATRQSISAETTLDRLSQSEVRVVERMFAFRFSLEHFK